jgi:hypothetical protein
MTKPKPIKTDKQRKTIETDKVREVQPPDLERITGGEMPRHGW